MRQEMIDCWGLVIVCYIVKGSQWKIKDKIGNVVKLKFYYCLNLVMKNVENVGILEKWLYFLVDIYMYRN